MPDYVIHISTRRVLDGDMLSLLEGELLNLIDDGEYPETYITAEWD